MFCAKNYRSTATPLPANWTGECFVNIDYTLACTFFIIVTSLQQEGATTVKPFQWFYKVFKMCWNTNTFDPIFPLERWLMFNLRLLFVRRPALVAIVVPGNRYSLWVQPWVARRMGTAGCSAWRSSGLALCVLWVSGSGQWIILSKVSDGHM